MGVSPDLAMQQTARSAYSADFDRTMPRSPFVSTIAVDDVFVGGFILRRSTVSVEERSW